MIKNISDMEYTQKSLLKGFTFRALYRHYSKIGYAPATIGRKVAKGLENAQIRKGELKRTPDKIKIE